MTRRITHALLSLVVLASLTLAPQGAVRAVAVTRYVSTTGGADATDCSNSAAPCLTIQYAINHAAADDTIEVAVGTYTATTGTEVVLIDRNLTLSGGWNAGFVSQGGLSTIDGGNARRGLTVDWDITATVDHFAVQNGFADWAAGGGGGIQIGTGSLTLTNSLVSHNASAGSGGGIYGHSASLTLANSEVSHNTGGSKGGGIFAYSTTMTISDSTISNNSTGSDGSGGGIQASGTITVNNTTISGNKVGAWSDGSAIGAGGEVALNNSTVSGNAGSTAIYFGGGNLTLNNSTVSGNSAPSEAGGIYSVGHLTLNNSTVTANRTANGVGGILNDLVHDGTVTLRNSIVAGNTAASGILSDCVGSISSGGYNVLGTVSGCSFTASTGDLVGTATAPIDPRLLPLGSYGGPTRTHALAGNSPAFGAGNPGTPGGGGGACLSVDQRGVTRPQGARCDMGAYEAQFPLVKSINRASPDPSAAATVKFSVTFSAAVTGVNKVAPFSDLRLITTGVTGAAISAVNGSGNAYTVSVKTGSGNGTVKLSLIDDGSIHDGKGNQLGGPGPRNGNFPTGQTYAVLKIPVLRTPTGTWWDRTPTYAWGKTAATTQYQYQLVKGTTTIYTRGVLSSACGATACTVTPSFVLDPANFTWRARALAGGIWQPWSPYLAFKLVAPKAGFWRAAYDMFYVAPDRSHVDDFASGIYVYGCGSYTITHTPLVAINKGNFAFAAGGYYASGVFDSTYPNASSAHGTVGFKSLYISNCGYITGGPFSWSAVWKNSNQPADAAGITTEPIVVAPLPKGEPAVPLPAPQDR